MKIQNQKKGLSTVVATLIIILLVLVAVGIVWVVVRNVVQKGTNQIDINSKCISEGVKATSVTCVATADGGNTGVCDVIISRNTGQAEIGGVKLVSTNDINQGVNFVYDAAGNLGPLEKKTFAAIDTGLVNASKVESFVYFLDEGGDEQLCPSSDAFNF